MAEINFDNVGKVYDGGTVAISNINLKIDDGEFLVLVGPSGCGKSTMLRSAAGLEEVTSGRFWLGGIDMTNAEPAARDVAMVFQNYALYPHMTVRDNICFALEQRRVPRSEIETRVNDAARILGLSDLLDRKPGTLSGGQRQRVAMGRAIVRNPRAFLMDEPLSNLDAKMRVQMRAELKLLSRRLGVTTLYVTHDQDEALTMGDRVAVLRPITSEAQSNTQQVDDPKTLYSKPCNLFVAGFIGSPPMNFLSGRVSVESDRPTLLIEGFENAITLPGDTLSTRPGLGPHLDKPLIVGIRPEDFRIAPEDSPDGFSVLSLVTETTGADSYIYFDLVAEEVSHPDISYDTARYDGDESSGHLRLTARVETALAPQSGSTVRLGIGPDRVHYFDPDTGNAIF